VWVRACQRPFLLFSCRLALFLFSWILYAASVDANSSVYRFLRVTLQQRGRGNHIILPLLVIVKPFVSIPFGFYASFLFERNRHVPLICCYHFLMLLLVTKKMVPRSP
jgi:hypothetical protein